jgi:hypothetical protein
MAVVRPRVVIWISVMSVMERRAASATRRDEAGKGNWGRSRRFDRTFRGDACSVLRVSRIGAFQMLDKRALSSMVWVISSSLSSDSWLLSDSSLESASGRSHLLKLIEQSIK